MNAFQMARPRGADVATCTPRGKPGPKTVQKVLNSNAKFQAPLAPRASGISFGDDQPDKRQAMKKAKI